MNQRIPSLIICTAMLTACSIQTENLSVDWDVIQHLPQKNGQPHLGLAGPVAGMIGDKLWIAGGANFPQGMPWDGGAKAYPRDAYVYAWEEGKLNLVQSYELDRSMAYTANTSFDGSLYMAGGEGEEGAVANVFRLRPDGQMPQTDSLPSLPKPLTNGGLVADNGALYFVGGENSEIVSDKIYKLALDGEDTEWVEFLTLPYPITHAVVVGDQKGGVYIAGGRMRNTQAKSDMYDAVWKVDLGKQHVEQITTLPQPLAAGTGLFLDDRLLIFGGDDASTFHQVEELIAQASKMVAGVEQDSVIAQKNRLQRNHPGFPKSVWSLDLSSMEWQQLQDLAGVSPVTTTAVLHGDVIFIPTGEMKAGVRTDQILVGKITRK